MCPFTMVVLSYICSQSCLLADWCKLCQQCGPKAPPNIHSDSYQAIWVSRTHWEEAGFEPPTIRALDNQLHHQIYSCHVWWQSVNHLVVRKSVSDWCRWQTLCLFPADYGTLNQKCFRVLFGSFLWLRVYIMKSCVGFKHSLPTWAGVTDHVVGVELDCFKNE